MNPVARPAAEFKHTRRPAGALPATLAACLIAVTAAANAEQRVADLSFDPRIVAADGPAVRIVPPTADAPASLVVAHDADTPKEYTLCVLDTPPPELDSPYFALVGEVSYADVRGTAYLFSLTTFGIGGTYFTKGLQADGPMGVIDGTSGWRPFILPFNAASGGARSENARPTRIELKLAMNGSGVVRVRGVRLMEYAADEGPFSFAAAWAGWPDLNRAGGIAGGAIGLLGASVGVLAGLGRARRFCLLAVSFLALGGLILLTLGLIVLAQGGPYASWYPLVLLGAICALIGSINFPILRRRFAELELRRMSALDAG